MKTTELTPLLRKRAEEMINDMRGIWSAEVREEIACELVQQGYVKIPPKTVDTHASRVKLLGKR